LYESATREYAEELRQRANFPADEALDVAPFDAEDDTIPPQAPKKKQKPAIRNQKKSKQCKSTPKAKGRPAKEKLPPPNNSIYELSKKRFDAANIGMITYTNNKI
jgi:hypothetical protein